MAEFKAFIFDGKRTAGRALDDVADISAAGYGWVDDVAVVSRGKLGMVRIDSTWAQDSSSVDASVGWGAVTGGLIGALAGPHGALAGALGGAATGGIIGTGIDVSVSDPVLEDFAASLENDTSALILVGVSPVAEAFVKAFADSGAKLMETTLSDEQIEELKAALV